MINGFSKINDLKYLYDNINKLHQQELELSKSIMTDLDYIPVIYNWFCELSGLGNSGKITLYSVEKKQFIFIIAYLYSPTALIGEKLRKGIRRILAEVLGYRSESGISNQLQYVLSWYENYKDFSLKVEFIYIEIMNRLKAEGKVP